MARLVNRKNEPTQNVVHPFSYDLIMYIFSQVIYASVSVTNAISGIDEVPSREADGLSLVKLWD